MCRCSRWNSGRLQHRRHIDTARGAHVLFGGRCAGREGAGEVGDAGNEKQGVWSVRDRGGGTSSPSPSAPPPVAISPRSSARGDPGEEPDTASHQLHPGHGCSPDIATHGPRPQEGAGEERRRRGWGGGAGRSVWVACRLKARAGRGGRQECTDIPAKARVRWGSPAEVYGYPLPKARAG